GELAQRLGLDPEDLAATELLDTDEPGPADRAVRGVVGSEFEHLLEAELGHRNLAAEATSLAIRRACLARHREQLGRRGAGEAGLLEARQERGGGVRLPRGAGREALGG